MINFLEKIEGIKNIEVEGGTLYHSSINGDFFRNFVKIWENIEVGSEKVIDGTIQFYTADEELVVLDNKLNLLITDKNLRFFNRSFSFNHSIFECNMRFDHSLKELLSDVVYLKKESSELKCLPWLNGFFCVKRVEEKTILLGRGRFKNRFELKLSSIFEDNSIWSFDTRNLQSKITSFFEKDLELDLKVLEVYQDKTWFSLKTGELIGVNLKTGKVEHHFFRPTNILGKYSPPLEFVGDDEMIELGVGSNLILDKESGLFFSINSESYIELDLQKGDFQMNYFDIRETMKKNNLTPYYSPVLFGRFIFMVNTNFKKIGIFDRKSKKVLYSIDIDVKVDYGGYDFKMLGDRLFLRTNEDNMLYIYQINREKLSHLS